MSVQQVTIPYYEANKAARRKEIAVGAYLDAGKDVQFIDETGAERNVDFIGLFQGADGIVKSRSVGMTDAQAVSKTMAAGGYLEIPVSYLYSGSTASSLGIHVHLG